MCTTKNMNVVKSYQFYKKNITHKLGSLDTT